MMTQNNENAQIIKSNPDELQRSDDDSDSSFNSSSLKTGKVTKNPFKDFEIRLETKQRPDVVLKTILR
jgi:hypothetical protein